MTQPDDESHTAAGADEACGALAEASGADRALLTTGDMARRSQTTVRTVRFYEEVGVLEPAVRTSGGHRLFPESELDKLMCVAAMRDAGLSLDEIKQLLGARAAEGCGAEASRRVRDALAGHIQAMTERIATLERLRGEFERVARALDGCQTCHDEARFARQCQGCESVPRPAPERALRVLWQPAPADEPGPDAS